MLHCTRCQVTHCPPRRLHTHTHTQVPLPVEGDLAKGLLTMITGGQGLCQGNDKKMKTNATRHGLRIHAVTGFQAARGGSSEKT